MSTFTSSLDISSGYTAKHGLYRYSNISLVINKTVPNVWNCGKAIILAVRICSEKTCTEKALLLQVLNSDLVTYGLSKGTLAVVVHQWKHDNQRGEIVKKYLHKWTNWAYLLPC